MKNLFARLFVIVILGISLFMQTEAQTTLSDKYNGARDGDSIVKMIVPYINPHHNPLRVQIPQDANLYCQRYMQLGDSVVCNEHNTKYYFRQNNDSMMLLGLENRMSKLDYVIPQLVQKNDFSVGDSISDYFYANGCYGDRLHIKVWGQYYVTAEETEDFVIDDVPFENGLRVHRHIDFIREVGSDTLSAQTITKDSVKEKLGQMPDRLVEDHYLWYIDGWRYPIMESVQAYHIEGGERLENFSTSFLYLPEWQIEDLPDDKENECIRTAIAENNVKDATDNYSFPVEIRASIGDDGKSVILHYRQGEEGTIKIIGCDIFGRNILYHTSPQPSGEYIENIPLKVKPIGNFIVLYLELNGQQTTVTINKNNY